MPKGTLRDLGNGHEKIRLTDKQIMFIECYIQTLNATEAARRAGYKGNDNTLASVGSENLQKPAIREWIDARLVELMVTDLAQVAKVKRTRESNRAALVYLIRAENGLVKIGKTYNLIRRFNTLNIGSPLDLEILGCIHVENASEVEQDLHARFAEKRVKGEWFSLSTEDLDIIASLFIVTPFVNGE